MKRLRISAYAVLTVLQCILLLASIEKPAYAYVDPGSGLLLVQVLSSTLGGIVFFLRKRLRRSLQLAKQALALGSAGQADEMKP